MNDTVIGYISVIIAVIFFGSQGVPIKKARTGDGFFFQWVTCASILIVGIIVNQFRDNPQFKPFAMLGGAFWCTGNITVIPIVKTIGFSLGIMIWGVTNLFMGWITGYLGLFGLKQQTVSKPVLNVLGAVVASASVVIYAFIKPENLEQKSTESMRVSSDGIEEERKNLINEELVEPTDDGYAFMQKMSTNQKRIFGVGLAVFAGVLYGINFVPPQYIIDHGSDLQEGIDYVLSHFCGIFLTSTAYLIIYCIVKNNKPQVFGESVLPGLVSGLFWAIAQVSFFIANSKLQMVVSFPMIATGPGCVGALWGIFLFKEISGKRNFLILFAGFVVNIVGVVLIALGK
eukprot:TRINITY_DN8414_c0_g1_i1.p1 TRINITY_DN8414_c0_g1~~TRINITY_DN8414_c0_g1_i1.p1  ORF type:complete len:344 (+),score=96.17 TRINITY_DN8414_c0_g1_i1:351-1382(+)